MIYEHSLRETAIFHKNKYSTVGRHCYCSVPVRLQQFRMIWTLASQTKLEDSQTCAWLGLHCSWGSVNWSVDRSANHMLFGWTTVNMQSNITKINCNARNTVRIDWIERGKWTLKLTYKYYALNVIFLRFCWTFYIDITSHFFCTKKVGAKLTRQILWISLFRRDVTP